MISSALKEITSTIIINGFKEVCKNIFNKNIETVIINEADFHSIIEDQILYEEFPDIEIRPLISFLKSYDVELIVRQIYIPDAHKSHEAIKDDFCLLFSQHFDLKFKDCEPFALKIYFILVEGCKLTLNKAILEGNISAHDAKTQFSLSLIEDKIDTIAEDVTSIKKKVDIHFGKVINKFVS